MPENDPNAYLPPELQQSPIDPVQPDPVSQQDAALAEAASSSGSGVGDLFLQMAAGFATGFATGYTGRDLLTPFLAQQAERRKERTARVKLLNQVGTLINSYEKGGAIVDELLGITPETSQEDRAKAYAALDQNQLRLIENQINLDRVESDNEEDRIAGLQSQLDSVRAQGAELGMEFMGDPTNRQEVEVYVNRVKYGIEQTEKGKAVARDLWQSSQKAYTDLGANVGAISDEDFQKGYLGPMEARYANEGKLEQWERDREQILLQRREAVKTYETDQANKFLESRSLPIVAGKQTGWNDLTDLQRSQMSARLSPEFDALDRIIDLPEHLRGFLGEPAQKMLDGLGFGDAKDFDDWAANGGDVQALLKTFPELQREVQKAEIMAENMQQVESVLPDELGLTVEDVEPAAVLAYKEGGIIQLTAEGKEKATQKLQELMDPSLPLDELRAIEERGKQFGIDIADIREGTERFSAMRSNDAAEAPSVFGAEQQFQVAKNFQSDEKVPIKFDFEPSATKLSGADLTELDRLYAKQSSDPESLNEAERMRILELERRKVEGGEQSNADERNRNSKDILLYRSGSNVKAIVNASLDPSTQQPTKVNPGALTAALVRAGDDPGGRYKELFIWINEANRLEAQTAGERAKSRTGADAWSRVVEVAGDDNFPDLEGMLAGIQAKWQAEKQAEYQDYFESQSSLVSDVRGVSVLSFDSWAAAKGYEAPGNLEVVNQAFGYSLPSSEIKFEVGDKEEVIDIEDFDTDELALFIASVGLNV